MRALLPAALLVAAFAAQGQAFYKWTDDKGRVHYGDRPPKGFAGKVERVDVEEMPAPLPTAPSIPTPGAPPVPRPAAKDAKAKPDARQEGYLDIAARRRATRDRLRADIDAAEGRLVRAKQALHEGEGTRDDERQVIQQMAGKPGTLPAAGRANCRTVKGSDGKAATMCPAVIPNEAYYERQRGLEDAVRQAEADLDRAKEAYRRGVD